MENIPKNMNQVFSKLSDLKYVFHFGEKLIPIIQSIIEFMRDVVPLLENINQSITDSTNDIPKASHQINNVTSATELATTEILDLVDSISGSLTNMERMLKAGNERYGKRKVLADSINEMIGNNAELRDAFAEYHNLEEEAEYFDSLIKEISKVNEESYKITLSLQVQDITAQQLAATNHLISSIQERLSSLIDEIQKSDIKDDVTSLTMDTPKDATFDPNARYAFDDRQDNANDIINNHIAQNDVDALINQTKKSASEQASQEEIDKLINAQFNNSK